MIFHIFFLFITICCTIESLYYQGWLPEKLLINCKTIVCLYINNSNKCINQGYLKRWIHWYIFTSLHWLTVTIRQKRECGEFYPWINRWQLPRILSSVFIIYCSIIYFLLFFLYSMFPRLSNSRSLCSDCKFSSINMMYIYVQ